jgi:hypothetical protein
LAFLEECARRFGDPFLIRLASYGQFVILATPAAVRDVAVAGNKRPQPT